MFFIFLCFCRRQYGMYEDRWVRELSFVVRQLLSQLFVCELQVKVIGNRFGNRDLFVGILLECVIGINVVREGGKQYWVEDRVGLQGSLVLNMVDGSCGVGKVVSSCFEVRVLKVFISQLLDMGCFKNGILFLVN